MKPRILIQPISRRPRPVQLLAPFLALVCAWQAAQSHAQVIAEPCGRAFVTLRMTAASAKVEALQFDVDYSAVGGGFVGTDAAVECVRLGGGGVSAPNDEDADKTLTLGHIFFTPVDAPLDLWRCSYATTGLLPDAGGFSITVVDASAPGGTPITVTVAISDITCDSGCGETPRSDCRSAAASVLSIKDSEFDKKDKLAWKWKKGAAFESSAISDPTTTGEYSVCLYADSVVLEEAAYVGPPSAWTAIPARGYLFKDSSGAAGGLTTVRIKPGAASKTSVVLAGKGDNLSDTLVPASSYTVQLLDRQKGACWSSSFQTGGSRPWQFKGNTH